MRIVGGELRGRGLAGPRSDAIRPTSDRLREAMFNVLTHAYDDPVAGPRVLDLFAGTGALACEAISRGAAFALLVDEGAEARGVIRQNLDTLGLGGVTRLFRRDATRLGAAARRALRPRLLRSALWPRPRPEALSAARDGGWLADDALAVVEEAASATLTSAGRLLGVERRTYGDTQVAFWRLIS